MQPLLSQIHRAEQLWWQGEVPQAIALLDPLRDLPGFWPEGAVLLAYLLRHSGDGLQAEALAKRAVLQFPDNLAAWEILMYAARDRPDYPGLCARFVAALRGQDQIARGGVKQPVMLALIRNHPPDWRVIAAKAQQGGLLGRDDMAVLASGIGFLDGVRSALAARRAPLRGWSLAILGSTAPCQIADDHCRIDLSWFRDIDLEAAWTVPLVRQLALALTEVIGPGTSGITSYCDVAAFTSGPELTLADFPATLIDIVLVATLLELTGADPDVRLAGRPMVLDKGALVVRAGRVELWALTTWALDRDTALAGATRAAEQALGHLDAPSSFAGPASWWPRLDARSNAITLCTNAGWYARPETAAPAFDDWATRYHAALTQSRAQLLVDAAEDLQRVASLLPDLRHKPLFDWDAAGFLDFLDGKSVVFATPFAKEMQEQYDSGAVAALWRDAGLTVRLKGLRTVDAPMSIWPHRPDQDWSASFALLQADCARAVTHSRADLFLAACGAYGLPIVHAMHQGFAGLTAVYNGHALNGYFGILTNDLRGQGLHRATATSRHWRSVNLDHRFPGLARIDDGRYVDGPDRAQANPAQANPAFGTGDDP